MAENTELSETSPKGINAFLKSEGVQNRIKELVKENSAVFTTSLLQIVNSSEQLKTADPQSILMAAITAATLDLPLNNNLGFAWVVPFGGKAQFQLGWKGFVQLAQRSGQFKSIGQCPVYKGQLLSTDPLNGHEFDFNIPAEGKPIGYVARFKLLNGFEATLYMTTAEMEAHAKKYSQTYKKNFGVWKDNFDAMAKKTVIKLLLSQYAPLSVTMQTALQADQSVIQETEDGEFQYVDNSDAEKQSPEEVNKELRALLDEKISAGKITDEKKRGRYVDIVENEEVSNYAKMLRELQAL